MLKGQIWVCDVCLQQKVYDGFPNDWYQVEIRTGDWDIDNSPTKILDKDCCSEKCLRATLRTYLED